MSPPSLPPRRLTPPIKGLTTSLPPTSHYAAPPTRKPSQSSDISYTRDPRTLVAYLIPFPKPQFSTEHLPPRFLIYTPPPPPIKKPIEGEKEGKLTKVQRKWQDEVRQAKTSDAKLASWKGLKGRATKGVDWGIGRTKTSNLEFLTRIEVKDDSDAKKKEQMQSVGVEKMVLVHPLTMPGSSEEIRAEFVNTMLRSKSKAQRDAAIATGLLPVTAAIDLIATPVWPFGGLLEIDAVWLFSSLKGAKASRNVTRRLDNTAKDEEVLKLEFTPSARLHVLERYLAARCHEVDPKVFAAAGPQPTETELLEAIGWTPSERGVDWEDEQWEIREAKDDLRGVMRKAAKEWDKWCQRFEKDPEKALAK